MSITPSGLFVKRQLPSHLNEYSPRFVELLRAYQAYLNRGDGLNQIEVASINREIESTYEPSDTKSKRFIKYQHAWDRISSQKSTGYETSRLLPDFMLERAFDTLYSSNQEYIETSDGYIFETSQDNSWAEEEWITRFGIKSSLKNTKLETADETTLVLILKQMYAAKGTMKCVQIFFSVFYDEDVTIYLPKFDICQIDDNFILDSNKIIRDDDVNQEYSYVVYVDNPPENYSGSFSEIYMKNFHPSGFRIKLKQRQISNS